MKHIKKFTTNEHFVDWDDNENQEKIDQLYDKIYDSEEYKKLYSFYKEVSNLSKNLEEKVIQLSKELDLKDFQIHDILNDIFLDF